MTENNSNRASWPSRNQNADDGTTSDTSESEINSRDAKGRFLTGNSGGGRKKGSRNRLTETVLAAIESDFAEHGSEALEKLRNDDSAAYLRVVASLLPRDMILKREQEPDLSDLKEDELAEMMWRAWRSSQLRKQLEGVKR